MNKILFFNSHYRVLGWADLLLYSIACYLRAKEFNCDDVHIILPDYAWLDSEGNRKDISLELRKNKYFPWVYEPKMDLIDIDNWDLVINTSLPNSLYFGFPGLNHGVAHGGWFMYKGIELFYQKTGTSPYIDIPRKMEIPYILFHFRGKQFFKGRGSSEINFELAFNTIKNHLKDKYEYWKMGEPSNIDYKFDKLISKDYNDFESFTKIIQNCSMMIVGDAGPLMISLFLRDIPILNIDRSPFCPLNNKLWRKVVGDDTEGFGSWAMGRVLAFRNNELPDTNKIIEFMLKFDLK